jgi:hypothetical protein
LNIELQYHIARIIPSAAVHGRARCIIGRSRK